jgi:hypothetical protein
MDMDQESAPTVFGVPLYMTFSCVSVTVVAARNVIAADTNLIGKGTSDPYAVRHCRRRLVVFPCLSIIQSCGLSVIGRFKTNQYTKRHHTPTPITQP